MSYRCRIALGGSEAFCTFPSNKSEPDDSDNLNRQCLGTYFPHIAN